MATTPQLQPEVAALFELSEDGRTRMFVPRLDREVNLATATVAEVEELLALPGGFHWIRRRAAAPVVVGKVKRPAAAPRSPRVRKSGSPGG